MESSYWYPQTAMQGRKACQRAAEQRPGKARLNACGRKQGQHLFMYAVLIGLLLITIVLMLGNRRYTVEGVSMEPSLQEWDVLYYTGFQTYGYSDLVIFESGEAYGMIVKRVIGLPGDRIQVYSDGRVTRNNVLLEENYMLPDELGNSAMGEIVVSEGMLFVLGDNRAESIDSRDARIGQIPISSVRGKVVRIIRRDDGR